jgi:ABC-type lipoprotein release transport system permease subunit
MVMLAVALTTGVGGALWLSRYLQSLVFETTTTDAASFAAAIVAIAAASCAATLVPLRRATSVDPAVVLRAE